MQTHFPLFSSPIDLAHRYWRALLLPTDTAIDATCGNGKDTLRLAQLLTEGRVVGMDVQEEALIKTRQLLEENLSVDQLAHVELLLQSHVVFPPLKNVKLIVYNLGYLPGGDKKKTTQTESTLESFHNALALISPGGAISLTCYPGHEEGQREQAALLQEAKNLSSSQWNVCHHEWLNRPTSPSLLFIQKILV